ncbi:MAG TPA: (E)-4-hydroxy-3-methylbut-2-enyl-diphosphate synthase [Candidatus Polarisedimenticolaceae bacterium]|nr:(E)-4-hydroxy-3-methylbut-2-enyl-diphosphate synthase [Candidatus Polarisedimenticolaceae bacterium]
MEPWSYDGLTYRRWPSRTVRVGEVEIGSRHPIRVQSMTTPSTKNTRATVDQIVRLVDAGCEIVRVTVPTSSDADALPAIRAALARAGLRVPLVADIHFTPAAALRAVEHVEKIRINPGNFADKKKFAVREYTDAQYRAELERIAQTFSPLVERAKELGVAMRIGTNHGSLSDRIMNRYGDTPQGMVESALEFVDICRDHGYHDLVLSMKASNPVVVHHVYRLLVVRMSELGMDYPIHLGVTEAGDGEDGRIKSALGIGTLLEEGIGDTVRVSLTEDPVAEIPVARRLVERYNRLRDDPQAAPPGLVPSLRGEVREQRDPHVYRRRPGRETRVGPRAVGGANPVRVEIPLEGRLGEGDALRRELDRHAGVRVPEETRAELVSVAVADETELAALAGLRRSLELVAPQVALSARIGFDWRRISSESCVGRWVEACHRLELVVGSPLEPGDLALFERLLRRAASASTALLFEVSGADAETAVEVAVALASLDRRLGTRCALLGLAPIAGASSLQPTRLLAARLSAERLEPSVVLIDDARRRGDDCLLGAAVGIGGSLCDGFGDSVQLRGQPNGDSRKIAYGILQAARVRITKTEFISCPSCGRTLFDLEETTARIKQRTAHLKGVKIAVMGCIVNGPGEMADADFGYVGWGDDKIALFVGREMVARDVPTAEADSRLVELIKQHGRWVDPPVPVAEDA